LAGSGDIVLSVTNHPQVQLSWDVDVGKMKDTQLYDMMARYYGAPRNPADDQIRMDIDLFSRPQGFLLFSIGGLSSNLLQSDLNILSKNLIDLLPSDTVTNSYGLLASVLTGTSGKYHGVHTQNTNGVKDIYATGNFYDAMRRLYQNKVIVSGSSTVDGTLVLSPHMKNFGDKMKGHYWDVKTKGFTSVSGPSKYGITLKDFPKLLTDLATAMEIQINYHEAERTVTMIRSGEELVFDLTCPAIESHIAEVLFVLNMAKNPVDFFSFHFESLVRISTSFGTASDEFSMAVRMIDAVIAKVNEAHKAHHSLEMSIIYSPETYHSKEVVTALEPILESDIKIDVGKNLFTTIAESLPNIYLTETGKNRLGEICSTIRNSLEVYSVTVDCPSLKRALSNTSEPEPVPSPSNRTEPPPSPTPAPPGFVPASQQEVELVHICLWTVIALIAAILQSCYHLSVLDGSNEPEFKPKTYEGAGVRSKTTKM